MPVRIVVDSREPSEYRRLLGELPGVEIRVERLGIGDYLIGPDAVIERKTGVDFASSILDGRLAEQSAQLAASYGRVFWLVEGDPLVSFDGLAIKALAGALSYLAVETKASVIRTDMIDQTVTLIASMARHFQDGNALGPTWRPSKPKNAELLSEFIVSGLPGIGRGRARALLARFGSVDAVFRASASDITATPGIGPKSAAAIRAAIDAVYPPPGRAPDQPANH